MWPCDDGSGNYIRDQSGNGLDLSPLNAPRWKSGVSYSVQRVVTPTIANGFFYECTTSSGNTGATEPVWPVIAGNTVADGSNTWTCRAIPATYWSANSGYVTVTNNIQSPAYAQAIRPTRLWEYLRPTPDGNISYTANTISCQTSDNSINDSALAGVGAFPTLAVGDWIWISGFTGNTANNTIAKILTATSAKIVFTAATGVFVDDAAGEPVTIRKVLPPMSLVFRFTITETMTFGGGADLHLMHYFYQSGSTTAGPLLSCTAAGPRGMKLLHIDTIGVAANHQSAGFLGSGSSTSVIIVVNRELSTVEFYFNKVRDGAAVAITKRGQCSLASTIAGSEPAFGIMYNSIAADGVTALKWLQLYIGRNLPAGLSGSGTPNLIQVLNDNPTTALTAAQWPA